MKNRYFSLLLICCLLIGGGCSNYKELNGVAIVVAMGLDYLPQEKKYIMIAQIINPSAIASQTGSQGIPVISVVAKGRTISEAARLSSRKNSRTNIYSHVALVALGETLVKKKSVKYIFDVFERDSKIRVNVPVIIARNNSVFEVLNTIPTLDKIPAKSIYGKIHNTSISLGENSENEIREVISKISSKGREPTINGVSIENKNNTSESLANMENAKSSYPFINGTGIFKN
ncbi:hypothetical protein [Bacillus sp. AFS017336]|uniref:Ger(x)C family spore germination protein n=1 Tax=Bacillus sp. AFS017336 TaxID=2033489 RepID=UPI000BF1EB71|nr:hypothetical protein [Bacillus sp. AFS017336]PEL08407.1 hypothetical protein CN601_16950 [Bacillus sp. AFS017336]